MAIRTEWSALDERVDRLLSRFGVAACDAELVCDGELCGHITAAARIWNEDRTRTLHIWSAKNKRWQLPGAHGEGDLNLKVIAQREARGALGLPKGAPLSGGEISGVNAQEIAEYWNTPTHTHLEIVFDFEEARVLPRGAQWFDSETAP